MTNFKIGDRCVLLSDAILGFTIKKGQTIDIIKIESSEPKYQVQYSHSAGGEVSIAWANSQDLTIVKPKL